MGRLILVCGTNSSGKSAFAEKLAAGIGGELYYLATMIEKTPENAARIKRHLCQRKSLNFKTVELAYQVSDAPVTNSAVVLLEDVSNLMANCLFDRQANASQVLSDILGLLERCATLIAVTISGLDSSAFGAETAAYIDSLNDLNNALFDRADTAIEMINNLPCIRKGVLDSAS
ncbi:MAG: bifunctional adenosylcobinamide kinase/adenosylcobinamide-phosphate guanylyltransferase [Candidatus Limiplasma sp.]|nr:bifunctional adenosylcobinamide kinase/adenosylcobinamide-phosphate guanylyltransferase [Candidatus Limiplasma sp.]